LVLAEFLETRVPASKFDLDSWTQDDCATGVSCDTAACAVGWACSIPEFRAYGFVLNGNPNAEPFFDGELGWEAVIKFFDIHRSAAEFLFYSGKYDDEPSITNVATRIRNFVATNVLSTNRNMKERHDAV
jgi:hypothetical protein